MIKTGFAEIDITPEIGSRIPGHFHPRNSTGVIEPLYAEVGVLEDGHQTFVLVGLDCTGLGREHVAQVRQEVIRLHQIPEHSIWIAASHSHGGGALLTALGTNADEDYQKKVVRSIVSAIGKAKQNVTPAEMVNASGPCDGWTFNRRFKLKGGGEVTHLPRDGSEIIGPAGPVDPELCVWWFRKAGRRKPLGCIVNFTCHPTIMFSDNFSPDFPGYWRDGLSDQLGTRVPMVFINGACGNIGPEDYLDRTQPKGIELATSMGNALAEKTLELADESPAIKNCRLQLRHATVDINYRRPSEKHLKKIRKIVADCAGKRKTKEYWVARDQLLLNEEIKGTKSFACPIDMARFGPSVLVAAPWQPFCEFGLRLKKELKGNPVMVGSFCNGSIGYIPTPAAFKGGGYEPTLGRMSKFTEDAGDRMVDAIIRMCAG